MKTALILGGSSGIGAATGELLHGRGWNILAPTHVEWDAEDIVRRKFSLRRRGDSLDALVYCAGRWHSAETAAPEYFIAQYRLSVIGLYAALCEFLPALLRAQGCVVAVSSTRGLIGGVKTAPYSCGKAGQIALMQGFAREYPGVRFNSVCPGLTATPMESLVRESGGCAPDAVAQPPETAAAAILRLIESDANGRVVRVVDGKEGEVAWR